MSHPGTYVNAPTLGVPGLVTGDSNTAVSFDPASNQYVVQDDTIAAQAFTALTIGLIVKPATTGDANNPSVWGITSAGVSASDEILLSQRSDGTFEFHGNGSGGNNPSVVSATTFSSGLTYRVIATWDGSTGKLYVNGALDASQSWANAVDVTDPEQFVLATDITDTTGNVSFNGVLDEAFFLANHAATDGEIAAIDAAMTGTGSLPTAINALSPYTYWRLGESSGTVAQDSAGGGTGNLYTPPIAYDMGPINPDTQGLQRALFRHYSPHGRFLPVWKLPDLTYTLEQPWPLVTPQDAQEGNLPIGNATVVTYLHVYQNPEEVSDAEAARLVASGIGTVT